MSIGNSIFFWILKEQQIYLTFYTFEMFMSVSQQVKVSLYFLYNKLLQMKILVLIESSDLKV